MGKMGVWHMCQRNLKSRLVLATSTGIASDLKH